jgi:predicted metal-dependent hydrolase
MTAMPYSITYGQETLAFDLLFSRRRTLQISVYPDGKIVVKVPEGIPAEEVKKRVLRRSRWIKSKLDYFQQFNPRTPARHYISGETHRYLGKQYRLKVIPHAASSVKLTRGRFLVSISGKSSPETVKALLDRWYAEKARQHFEAAFERCWQPFSTQGYPRPTLKIRTMKTRWGSLSSKGFLTLNPKLVCAPQECIDYVLTHEICHLAHRNHGPAFFRLLEQSIPDWKKRKDRLELSLV